MEDKLHKIILWASHGTPRQFFADVQARLSSQGYICVLEDDTISFFRVRKEGGFLGFGAKQVKEPVGKIVFADGEVDVPTESLDPTFLDVLVERLQQH